MEIEDVKRLWRAVGSAIGDFGLIEDGDRLALGLSGGKDSMLLAYALARFARVAPIKFEVLALTIDGGFPGMDPDRDGLGDFCSNLGITHHRRAVPIYQAIRVHQAESGPCPLCSKLRRGALHAMAKELGCGKVVLAHHADDALETLVMNLIFNGRMDCFQPKTYLSKTGVTVIRPMVYVWEKHVVSLARALALPVVANACPANGNTMRHEVKRLLAALEAAVPGAKARSLAALSAAGGPWHDSLVHHAGS